MQIGLKDADQFVPLPIDFGYLRFRYPVRRHASMHVDDMTCQGSDRSGDILPGKDFDLGGCGVEGAIFGAAFCPFLACV